MKISLQSWTVRILGVVAVFLTGAFVSAEGLSLYGSVTAEALAGLSEGDSGDGGYESEIRIIAETTSASSVLFRGEAGILLSYGLSSEPAIAFDSKAVAPPAQLPPGDDLHRDFFIDQAWAETGLAHFSLQAGIIPVSWGSAYIYNPVSRTQPPSIPGENLDRAIGRPGIKLFLPLPGGFSAEGYVLASPRIAEPVPHIAELESHTVPYGVKLQFLGSFADFSLYALRELMTDGNATYWFGADSTVIIGDVTVYAEYATTRSFSAEVASGFSYTVPVVAIGVRGEYIFLASGEEENSYDGVSFMEGSRKMLGRHYLFFQLEKEDPNAAAWKVSAGTMVNIKDKSAALLAEALWRPIPDFSIGLFARIFTASKSGTREFGGSIPLGPGMAVCPYRDVAGLTAEWHF